MELPFSDLARKRCPRALVGPIRLAAFIFWLMAGMGHLSAQEGKTGLPPFDTTIVTGAERMDAYLSFLSDKQVGIVANPTSIVGESHLLDTLLARNIEVTKVFAPEHGLRGRRGAGEKFSDEKDPRTGLPVISLYGDQKKPTEADLEDVDVLVFDIQDVGVRFYTYISTLHYIMEAAARDDKTVMVLDRPNPNGFYVDGPVLEPAFESFVGLHPVPMVHGMTIGEYARMINGEGWLKNGDECALKVIPCKNYEHDDRYRLPVRPSPNLPNMASVYLYPTLGLFEGTPLSVGRGTDKPFQVVGHPELEEGSYRFTPKSKAGRSKNPKLQGKECRGYDLELFGRNFMPQLKKVYLFWLKDAFRYFPEKADFFNDFFDLLAGTDELRKKIKKGVPEEEIRASWKADIEEYKRMRKDYLLYDRE